jgi:hypothetical protein
VQSQQAASKASGQSPGQSLSNPFGGLAPTSTAPTGP